VLQENCSCEGVKTANTISFPSSTLSFAKTDSDPGAKHKRRAGCYLQRERKACLESGTHVDHSLNTTLQTERRATRSVQILLKMDLKKIIPPSFSHYPLQSKASAGHSFCTGCQTVTALLKDYSGGVGQI